MKILLIGANSYVGARLFFDLSKEHDIIGTFSTHPLSLNFIHLDITNTEELTAVVETTKPEVIIHVANNASASWCEAHPNEAIKLNQTSTKRIARLALTHNAKLIYLSSMGAIDQTTLYGKTKIASEKIIKSILSNYLILRPSLILGISPNTTNDRPFNRLLKNLDEHTPAMYNTSWKFQPTYIRHISEVIEQCIDRDIWGETISIATPETTTRFQSAYDILTPFGVTITPMDKHDTTFSDFTDSLNVLKLYSLPMYSYKKMIIEIIEEISHRSMYRL